MTSLEAALVEIAAGTRDWTVIYAGTPRTPAAGTVARGLDPVHTVPGYLAVRGDVSGQCAAGLAVAST